MTEYLYDREHPKSHFRQRLTGIEGFMYGNPNMHERADMIGRALAKETDGDFTKFVHKTAKPRDMAQKWRAFKNISRLFKNPLGYTFWRCASMANQNRIRAVYVILIWHLYNSFYVFLTCKKMKEGMMLQWLWAVGEVNDQVGLPKESRMPADRKKNYVRYSNFHQIRRNKRTSMIHTNWWCRDQNFRKYFEMRKRHNIKPAISGFYHDSLYEETLAKNKEWAALRQTRSAR
jgi:hypothetical protein